jgi:hypothetical protein
MSLKAQPLSEETAAVLLREFAGVDRVVDTQERCSVPVWLLWECAGLLEAAGCCAVEFDREVSVGLRCSSCGFLKAELCE